MTDSQNRRRGDDPRVFQLEQDVHELTGTTSGFEASLESHGRQLGEIKDAILNMQKSQKFPVANVISVIALVVVVIGMFGSGYVRDLNRVEANVDKIGEHRYSENDDVQDATIEAIIKIFTSRLAGIEGVQNKTEERANARFNKLEDWQKWSIRRELGEKRMVDIPDDLKN